VCNSNSECVQKIFDGDVGGQVEALEKEAQFQRRFCEESARLEGLLDLTLLANARETCKRHNRGDQTIRTSFGSLEPRHSQMIIGTGLNVDLIHSFGIITASAVHIARTRRQKLNGSFQGSSTMLVKKRHREARRTDGGGCDGHLESL